MSHQPVIDGFEFASAGAAQQGVWPLSGFARLRELLASDAGEVGYALQGTRDARGRPSLRVSVRGTLQLRCQRSEEHTSELQSLAYLVCRLLLEKKKKRLNCNRRQIS